MSGNGRFSWGISVFLLLLVLEASFPAVGNAFFKTVFVDPAQQWCKPDSPRKNTMILAPGGGEKAKIGGEIG